MLIGPFSDLIKLQTEWFEVKPPDRVNQARNPPAGNVTKKCQRQVKVFLLAGSPAMSLNQQLGQLCQTRGFGRLRPKREKQAGRSRSLSVHLLKRRNRASAQSLKELSTR